MLPGARLLSRQDQGRQEQGWARERGPSDHVSGEGDGVAGDHGGV